MRYGSPRKNRRVKDGNDDKADYDDDDTDDDGIKQDYNKLLKAKEEQRFFMLHQEVDPLERIHRELIRYEAFERVFYHPTNTSAGHASRKEQDNQGALRAHLRVSFLLLLLLLRLRSLVRIQPRGCL